MRIQLSSEVTIRNIDPCLINVSHDLHIIRRPHILHALKSALRDEAGALSGFRAPCDCLVLDIADDGVGFRWRPEAEVVKMVQECSLATRLLVFGGAIAQVVTELAATGTVVGIRLIRL